MDVNDLRIAITIASLVLFVALMATNSDQPLCMKSLTACLLGMLGRRPGQAQARP